MKDRLDPKFIIFGGHQELSGVESVTLGDLVLQEPDYGAAERAKPIESPDDVKYIRITDFDDNGIAPGNEFVTAETVEDKYALQEGDVLFARSGATAGKTFIYTADLGSSIFAGYCIRFRFDSQKVLPKFVYFYTKSERYDAWVRSMQRPSGQPNINKEEFKSFTIPLPPLETQRVLADELEAARTSRRDKLAQADALLNGLDAWLLDRLGLQPPHVEKRAAFAVTLGQVSADRRLNADYYHPERLAAIREQKERSALRAEPLVDVADFIRGQKAIKANDFYLGLANVASNTGELVDTEEEVAGTVFEFQRDDVLFARLRPYLNKVHRAERNGVCSPEFHVIRVRPAAKPEDEILPDYLATILRSSLVLAQTRHMMTGNTHPRLANEDVTNLIVPFPDKKVQEAIAAEVQRRREYSRRLRGEANAAWDAAKARFEAQLLMGGASPCEPRA